MDSTPDFYTILGVPEHTNQTGIRKAYLQKAWKCHPDVNTNVPELTSEMSDVNRAYSTLSNPSLRADYDARRHAVFVTRSPLLNDSSVVYVDTWAYGRARSRSSSSYRHKRDHGLYGLATSTLRRFCRFVSG